MTRADINNGPSLTQALLLGDRRPARALAAAFPAEDNDRSCRAALAGALRLLPHGDSGTGRT